MARYTIIATGKSVVSKDPKLNGKGALQTGIYAVDYGMEVIAKTVKRATVNVGYGSLKSTAIDISFDDGKELCRRVDAIMQLKGRSARIERLILIDHGYMLEKPEMVTLPGESTPKEMKGVLAFGDGRLGIHVLSAVSSELKKIGRWCDADSHVIFLNCNAGRMTNLMKALAKLFGCRVTGPNQLETGMDPIHHLKSDYTYTTYSPNGNTAVTDERPF